MAADSNGMDLAAVGVILSSRLFVADHGITIPTAVDLANAEWVLPTDFKPAGLMTTDGGFDWTLEADGDPTEFLQDGYSLPSGLAKAELKTSLAQTDATVRRICFGKTPDANGYITIDAGGHSLVFVLYAEEIFQDGRIRRRVAGKATVKSVKESTTERGSVKSYETTFKIERSADLNNEHLGEVIIPAAA